MTVTWPLGTDFIDRMGVTAVTFMPSWGQEIGGQASGRIRVKDLRPALWTASLTAARRRHATALETQADLLALNGSEGTFLCYDPRRPGPKADREGLILGAATVTIRAVGDDNKSVSLEGLTDGYVLSKGDYFAYVTGAGLRGFHQLLEDATADGDGITAAFAVGPLLRVGVEAGLAVILVKPAARMMVLPGTLDVASVDRLSSSVTFQAIEVPADA